MLRHETGWAGVDDGGGAGEGGHFEAREGSRTGGISAKTSKMDLRRRGKRPGNGTQPDLQEQGSQATP